MNQVQGSRDNWIAIIAIVIACLAARVFWISTPGFAIDQAQFVHWAEMSRAGSETSPPGGLPSVYAQRPDGRYWCNYPPGYIYVLKTLAFVFDSVKPGGRTLDASVIAEVVRGDSSSASDFAVSLFKTPAIIADAATGVLLFLILSARWSRKIGFAVALAYVLLPAVIHDSTVWGQVDSIPVFFALLSLEFAVSKRFELMAAAAALGVLFKAQMLMFIPIWAVIAISAAQWDARAWGRILAPAIGVAIVVLYPFRTVLGGVWESYAGAAGFYPYIHLNGFSVWFLVSPLDQPSLGDLSAYARDNVAWFAGVTPRTMGLFAVLGSWAFVARVMLRRQCDERSIAWAARLLPLTFFCFSTQMHERYLFPAMAIWAWAWRPTSLWIKCWIAIAVCALANQAWVWPGPDDTLWSSTCVFLQDPAGFLTGFACAIVMLFVTGMVLMTAPPVKKKTESRSAG